MFKNMRIGIKIGFGFIVILLLAMAVMYFGHKGLLAMEDRVDKVESVNRLVKYALGINRSGKNYALTHDRQYADEVLANLDGMKKQAKKTREKFKQDVNKTHMSEVLAITDNYDDAFHKYLDIEAQQKTLDADMVQAARDLEKIADDLKQYQKKEYSRLREKNASKAEQNDILTKSDDANLIINWIHECRRNEKNFILRNDEKSSQQLIKNIKNIIDHATDLKRRLDKEETQKMAEQIIIKAKEYQKAFFNYKELSDGFKVNLEKMMHVANSFNYICKEVEADQKNKMLNEMASAKNRMLSGIIAAIVLGIILSFIIIRAITIPISRITEIARKISDGDFIYEVEIVQNDEIGQLADIFRNLKESLQEKTQLAEKISKGDLNIKVKPRSTKDVLGNALAAMTKRLQEQSVSLKEAINVISSSTSEIAATVTELATSVSETATSANETTTTMEEIKQTADLANKKSKTVSENAQQAQQISITGKQATDETIDGMSRIKTHIGSIAESIVTLSEQNQAIGEIIATVDDIAEQTNLLAVNSSIEAVKAGEMGKGFSVVAQEIKSLAKQSKQATKRVRTILNEVQKATGKAVLVTEEGSKTVEEGIKQARKSGDAISTLTGSITTAAHTAIQIAASSQQQLVGMDQVGMAMMNIKEASAQNASGTKQLEIAARNLDELGQKLKQKMEWYKFEA
ncbi:methyl-accepting chemotaxis protein [Desulfobacula phenolica]|uniref:Methyl-accepting chemotaxis sensory transducer n=1 Tax=Desulfobacula phenolica TaxID=90732 RepID=A0A1H2G928_9BACT|nr:HAMP domain-containing methyl-accepting chemotaxis protein [Desulfobacula phenolica]SDU16276.1 methyl-accepting chemotaxis sensory transducer [Desulfobacula phenolica]